MCGIFGGCLFNEKKVQNFNRKIIKLFLQSKIRGRHSSGFSFYSLSKLKNFNLVLPIPAEKFVLEESFSERLKNLGKQKFVGHVRYSTSDLEYNQPIKINKNFSIVHNGVITQREFEYWEKDFEDLLEGYKLKTKNDSELLGISFLRFLKGEEKFNPFFYFKDSSIACIVLYKNTFYFFRNGKRPLYFYKSKNYFFICSTKDIFLRCGFKESFIKKIEPFVFYKLFDKKIKKQKIEINKKDWQ